MRPVRTNSHPGAPQKLPDGGTYSVPQEERSLSHKRIPKRKAAIAAGSVVALGAAAILLPNANASQDGSSDDAAAAPKTLKAGDASDLASQLSGLLGEAFGGSYYDGVSHQLVVNVVPGDNSNVVVQAKAAGA